MWKCLLIVLFCCQSLFAASLSSSGVETRVHYKFQFRSLLTASEKNRQAINKAATHHANHIFGVFHSPEVAEKFGFPKDLTEGFAGAKHPTVSMVKSIVRDNDDQLWIEYEANTQAILLNSVAESIFVGRRNSAALQLPLIRDMTLVYKLDFSDYVDKKFRRCTDPSHSDPEDFYYFYNPFRCKELSSAPISESVDVEFQKIDNSELKNQRVDLVKLHGDNQNGRLMTLYFTYGFGEDVSSLPRLYKDSGWKLFQSLENYLTEKLNFTLVESTDEFRQMLGRDLRNLEITTPVNMNHEGQRRFFRTFVRQDRDITWVVRSALFNTENEPSSDPLVSFPKFWKEAWENGDFIYYGGHSGDGQSLNYSILKSNLRNADLQKIAFQKDKSQVAFFDSCSSFAHFSDMYQKKKPIHLNIINYGLVSLFHLAQPTVEYILDTFVRSEDSGRAHNPKWLSWLNGLEESQLYPHLRYSYGKNHADSVVDDYRDQKIYPSYLINVTLTPAD